MGVGSTGKVRCDRLIARWRLYTSRLYQEQRMYHGGAYENVMEPDKSINVLGTPLVLCGTDPVTGFFRDGYCNTCDADQGSHTVCAVMTAEFLAFSKYVGNDLSTPRPEYGFAGLKPGDAWCLCASRFLQAAEEGLGPKVSLAATHIKAADVVPLAVLEAHAIENG